MSSEVKNSSEKPLHLLVICHGLFGFPEKMEHVKQCLERKVGSKCLVYAAQCNRTTSKNKGITLDGVDAGGKRIREEVEQLVVANPHLRFISLCGFSLGGLYARYFAASAFNKETGLICGLEPWAYLTISAPHLGVKHLLIVPGWATRAISWFVPLESRTVKQLYTDDHVDFLSRSNNKNVEKKGEKKEEEDLDAHLTPEQRAVPLLVRMTRKKQELPYFESLAAFPFRCIYANTQGDLSVPYQTGSINPFESSHLHHACTVAPVFVPDPRFPSIVNVREAVPRALEGKMPYWSTLEDELARGFLEEMTSNLNELSWRRVCIRIPRGNAHQICIGKGVLWNSHLGKDVGEHLALFVQTLMD